MASSAFDRQIVVGALAFLLFLLAILVWPVFSEFWSTSKEQERIFGALLGTIGTLITAIVGILLFGWQRNAGEFDKKQDRIDFRIKLASALRAEIAESLVRWRRFSTEDMKNVLTVDRKNLENAAEGENGMPFGVALQLNQIFVSHQAQLFELPEPVIRLVISYYQNDMHFVEYLNAVADGKFSRLSMDRQKKAVVNLRDLGMDALRSSLRAKAILDAYLMRFDEKNHMIDLKAIFRQKQPDDDKLLQILKLDVEGDAALLSSLPKENDYSHYNEWYKILGVNE